MSRSKQPAAPAAPSSDPAQDSAPDTAPERVRALIDVPVLPLGAPGTVAVLEDGVWRAVPV
jgi:hypothetical protein